MLIGYKYVKKNIIIKKYFIVISFVVGLCSIIYELLISTISSYLMGDSIVQFSLIIGFYLASMGIGAFLSRFFVTKDVLLGFIGVEILLGLVGAFSVPLCYLFFALSDSSGYQFFVLTLVSLIGTLTGFEIPLLTRILENKTSFEKNISDILTFDYLGALGATLLFPFFLLPFLGLYRSSLLFGLINLLVAFVTIRLFKDQLEIKKQNHILLNVSQLGFVCIIVFMIIKTDQHLDQWNDSIYKFPIIHTENSPYQKIDIAKTNSEFRLYLNGAIQFSSRDEYRYHEALVHVPLCQLDSVFNVLVLGGGEGLAIREILKYPEIKSIDVVDIDPAITNLATSNAMLARLNNDALKNEKVTIIHQDAFTFLKEGDSKYGAIIIDLPDPSNESLARLYSDSFFKLCLRRLSSDGIIVTQATSPNLSNKAFWCINETLRYSGFDYTYPYHLHIPSFGNWGFVMARRHPTFNNQLRKEIEYKFLEHESFDHLFYFSKDIRSTGVEINKLDKPILLEYYLEHWKSLQGTKR